jgi:hypothetical protein
MKNTGNKSLIQNVHSTLAQSVELLQDLKVRAAHDQTVGQSVDDEMVKTLSVLLPLLPAEIQEQVQSLLALRNDIRSPYLGRATTMTQLHRRGENRPDLPGWAQPE